MKAGRFSTFVVAGLIVVLLDPKSARKVKQQDLKFLVHYLQDLHQPVHVGDNGDRGGNDLQLRWFETNRKNELHFDRRVTCFASLATSDMGVLD
jgi:hypothetical protein